MPARKSFFFPLPFAIFFLSQIYPKERRGKTFTCLFDSRFSLSVSLFQWAFSFSLFFSLIVLFSFFFSLSPPSSTSDDMKKSKTATEKNNTPKKPEKFAFFRYHSFSPSLPCICLTSTDASSSLSLYFLPLLLHPQNYKKPNDV